MRVGMLFIAAFSLFVVANGQSNNDDQLLMCETASGNEGRFRNPFPDGVTSDRVKELEWRMIQLEIELKKKVADCEREPFTYISSPTRQESWKDAKEFCEGIGGHLAVQGMKTLETRRQIAERYERDSFWIGANDIGTEDRWMWVDGSEATEEEMHWSSGEPNNQRHFYGRQDCAMIVERDDWLAGDKWCGLTSAFALCEIPNC